MAVVEDVPPWIEEERLLLSIDIITPYQISLQLWRWGKPKQYFSPCYDGISGISSFFCPLSRVSHGNVLPFKIPSIRRYQSEWLPARYDDGYLPKKIGYKWARNRRSRELFPKIWAHHHSYVTLSFRPIFFLPCVQNTYWYCGVSIRPLFL